MTGGALVVTLTTSTTLVLTTSLEIADYSLETFEIILDGTAMFGVSAALDISSELTYADEVTAATISFGTYSIPIGPIVVVITPSMPINVGYTFSLTGAISISAEYSVTATAQLGLRYAPPPLLVILVARG